MTAYETPLRTRRKGDKSDSVTIHCASAGDTIVSLSEKHLLSMAQLFHST